MRQDTEATDFSEQHPALGKRLPALLDECTQRWSLTVRSPFPNLSIHYVAPVVRSDGTEAVLKIGLPHRELLTEVAALRLYDGRHCVRLLEADP